jgi:hypothetical protein
VQGDVACAAEAARVRHGVVAVDLDGGDVPAAHVALGFGGTALKDLAGLADLLEVAQRRGIDERTLGGAVGGQPRAVEAPDAIANPALSDVSPPRDFATP